MVWPTGQNGGVPEVVGEGHTPRVAALPAGSVELARGVPATWAALSAETPMVPRCPVWRIRFVSDEVAEGREDKFASAACVWY